VRRVADELVCHIAEIGVTLVARGHVVAVLLRALEQNVRQSAPADRQHALVFSRERRAREEPGRGLEVVVLQLREIRAEEPVLLQLLGRRTHGVGGGDPVGKS
jgi:hypothetical protein